MGIFNVIQGLKLGKIAVAPLVGAWIEIIVLVIKNWGSIVAPLVGAWIEIAISPANPVAPKVAPLVGAWIEIAFEIADF